MTVLTKPADLQATNGFPTRQLGHMNLYVGDLEASMAFYVNVCGLEEVFRERSILAGFVSNGTRHHDVGMIQVSAAPKIGRDGQLLSAETRESSPGLNHLAFEVDTEAEVVAGYRYLLALGLKPAMTVDHGLARSVYIRDPSGNLIEFYADSLVDWREFFDDALARDAMVTGPWTPGATEPSTRNFFDDNPVVRSVEGAPLQPVSIKHVALAVPDLEAALAFYLDLGGMTAAWRSDNLALLKGRRPGVHLALVADPAQAAPRIHHATFLLASRAALSAGEAALAKAGVPIERRIERPGKSSLVIADPDGNLIEFAHYDSIEPPELRGDDAESQVWSV